MQRNQKESKNLVSQLIEPLSHEKRFETFLTLSESSRNISELTEALRAKKSAIRGWLRRLQRAGLVKYEMKTYRLTNLGRAWMGYLKGAIVIVEQQDFFIETKMERIPREYVGIVKFLNDCEVISGLSSILSQIEKMKENIMEAQEMLAVGDISLLDFFTGEILLKKLMSDEKFKFCGISKFLTSAERQKAQEFVEHGAKMRKDAKNAIYMGILLVDDKEVGITFPRGETSLNWDRGFYSIEPAVIAYSRQIFWDIWEKCEPF
jgi:predicted transcriptional regulator